MNTDTQSTMHPHNCSVGQYDAAVTMAISATAVWWIYWWWCGAAMVLRHGSRRCYLMVGGMAAYMNLAVCYDQISYKYRNEMSGLVWSLHNTLGPWFVMPIILGLKNMGVNQCNSVKWGITYFYAIILVVWWSHRAFCRMVYKTPETPDAASSAPEPPQPCQPPQPPHPPTSPHQGAVAFGQSQQHRLIRTGQPSPISFQHNGQHIGQTIVATNYYNSPAYASDDAPIEDADLSHEMYMR